MATAHSHSLSRRRRAARQPAQPETEKGFMATIVELAKRCGWRTYHTYDSRKSEPGFPDLCMVRRERILFVEVKTARGRVSLAQATWLAALRATPLTEVALWRPADWPTIVETLR